MSKEACNAANRELAESSPLNIRQAYLKGMRDHLYRVRMNYIYRAFGIDTSEQTHDIAGLRELERELTERGRAL